MVDGLQPRSDVVLTGKTATRTTTAAAAAQPFNFIAVFAPFRGCFLIAEFSISPIEEFQLRTQIKITRFFWQWK